MSYDTTSPDQPLTNQMGTSSREIARRLHVLNLTDEDCRNLASVENLVVEKLPDIVEEYYAFQLRDQEISAIIGDADTLTRLKGYMHTYIKSLFSGNFDQVYVNTRLRIGKVHKRLDVRPKLYMTAYTELHTLLDRVLEDCVS
ncbi:protoglobin domain-containing protein [Sneathiella limimaris]|uniref:protoglobin domain-containing protein n=1 Tax=Sneathiella limimaris TaxID=1964213 RepID=UPI00146CEA8A|nr:protoglobin domain-containing protein [Sneathiella limimaris]